MNSVPVSDFDPLLAMLSPHFEDIQVRRGLGNAFMFDDGDMELYIRVMPGNWFTVARIDVGENNGRKGIGTMILNWCMEYCCTTGIPMIIIESVLTIECEMLCKKLGFVLRYPHDDICRDWMLTIS